MKKLILLGFIAGLLGAVSAILITEVVSFSNNWQYFAVGSIISVSISILLVRALYGKYVEFTKDSHDAIRRAKQALNQR
jgi:membrane protein implicated in regulation of membrane protease activity